MSNLCIYVYIKFIKKSKFSRIFTKIVIDCLSIKAKIHLDKQKVLKNLKLIFCR